MTIDVINLLNRSTITPKILQWTRRNDLQYSLDLSLNFCLSLFLFLNIPLSILTLSIYLFLLFLNLWLFCFSLYLILFFYLYVLLYLYISRNTQMFLRGFSHFYIHISNVTSAFYKNSYLFSFIKILFFRVKSSSFDFLFEQI